MKRTFYIPSISAFLFILLLFNLSCALEEKSKKIDELMTYCYDNGIFNGAVLIAHNGKVLYKNAFGYSNLETGEKLKINSAFYIGSVSKQFTAMAIMILKEQNKLTYEDKLVDYFPEIPFANKITIRNLLNHTSGTLSYNDFIELKENGVLIDGLTNEDVIKALIKRDSLNFKPGEGYSYSNTGYILLAMIVEKVSGKPFYVFMKQNIFNPLGMKSTLVWNKTKPEIPNKTVGFNQYGEKSDYNGLTAGPGGIYSTVEDLYKWDQALYTEKLVSQETLLEAFTPGLLDDGTFCGNPGSTWYYGFGWVLRKNNSDNIAWHTGGFNGFNAVIYRELNKHQVIIILDNMGTYWQMMLVYDQILNILNDKSFKLPQIPILIKLKNMIDKNGFETAINKFDELRTTYAADNYDFSSRELNDLGYFYLSKQKFYEAKTIFELNTKMFPEDANTYDSYAEACMLSGDYDEAIKYYKKSLEMDPGNLNAAEMLKKLNEMLKDTKK